MQVRSLNEVHKAIARAKRPWNRFYLWLNWKHELTFYGFKFHYRWCFGRYSLSIKYTLDGRNYGGPL